MATAKQKKYNVAVKDFMSGKQIKVECEACYNEEGSYACVRPSHPAWQGRTEPVTKDVLATAIITRPEMVPAQTKVDLAPISGKYMK